jgi:hypothetical protein
MKNFNKFALVAASIAMFGLANQASAQYRPTGDDGITASPKHRQFLDEHKTVASAPSFAVASVGYQAVGDDGIAASPKLRQMLDQRKMVASAPSTAVVSVGYRAVGADGIAASPKLRQQLDERGTQPVMVAPLK